MEEKLTFSLCLNKRAEIRIEVTGEEASGAAKQDNSAVIVFLNIEGNFTRKKAEGVLEKEV